MYVYCDIALDDTRTKTQYVSFFVPVCVRCAMLHILILWSLFDPVALR